jgi:S1-C subfamily serine protease
LGAAPPAGVLGMLIRRFEGSADVVVHSLTPGGPASSCGMIRPGHRLVAVDGRGVAELSLDDVHYSIGGPPGTTISLTLLRPPHPGGRASPQRSPPPASGDAQRASPADLSEPGAADWEEYQVSLVRTDLID